MFEIESKSPDEVTIITKKNSVNFNLKDSTINANLPVGKIVGPGEFEIGDIAVRGIDVGGDKTIYAVEVGGVHVGIIGDIEEKMDELVADILCTSSVRAIREIEPRLIVSMGNADGMVSELKLTARTEKRLKVKSLDSLSPLKEVVILN
ncbi:MAG: hypothetical protein Q4A79_01510 [Candidatus Saccharibacteria bacterium]|nr:hypothetical protein [Candidatus Saccharibacteria bacterium]